MRAPVVTLVDGLKYPTALAIDGSQLYYADAIAGVVASVDIRSGARAVLARRLQCPLDLALDATHVYVSLCAERGRVVRIPREGGKPQLVARTHAFPGALALDEERVYWACIGADRDDGLVLAAPKAGGAVALLAEGQNGPVGIGLDASDVVWIDQYDWVLTTPKTGGARPVVLHRPDEMVEDRIRDGEPRPPLPERGGMMLLMRDPSPPDLHRIALRDGYVYWRSVSGVIAMVGLWDTDRPASSPALLAVDPEVSSAVALDDEWAYWTDARHNRIRRVRRSGGRPRTIAAKQARPRALAVDGEAIYWTTAGARPDFEGGAIRMRSKDALPLLK